jgi:NAD-dependent SIR2 family protein deacetylase
VPEIEIRINVEICSRCHHLWQRRRDGNGSLPITCPNCNSPYWNSMPKRTRGREKIGERKKLVFHGEKVLDSNFDEVFGKESHKK